MIENDDVFDALATRQRRALLVSLRDTEFQFIAPLSDSSGAVADAHEGFLREFLRSSREMDGVDKELLRFHHVDLPMLAKRGFIEWTEGVPTVTKGPRFDELLPLVELLDTRRQTDSPSDVILTTR